MEKICGKNSWSQFHIHLVLDELSYKILTLRGFNFWYNHNLQKKYLYSNTS